MSLKVQKVYSQIIPDTSLPVDSSVSQQDNTVLVEKGTRVGSNLFHSFQEFSVSNGQTVYFNNLSDIQNIISRVTGGNISNIDGLIKANGVANLFLINSQGLIFGSNAKLDIGGSFLATTANRLDFANGAFFSSASPQLSSVLTLNVPVGLGFESNSNSIVVYGTGQGLNSPSTTFSPLSQGNIAGLSVKAGKTLALVGGDIFLTGATLTSNGGVIKLVSVDLGIVNLSLTSFNWDLTTENITNFKNIYLSQQALVNVSGISSGSIQLTGNNIKLVDGSVIWLQNKGKDLAGNLKVDAVNSLELSGNSRDGKIATSLRSEAIDIGKGANIEINSQRIVLEKGAGITSLSYSEAQGGSLNINTSELQILGVSPDNPSLTSNTGAYTFGKGAAGDITISTSSLLATGGGAVASTTLSFGAGGTVTVNAKNFIELIGENSFTLAPSKIGTSAFGEGNAGKTTINTSKLLIADGAIVNSSTVSYGSAGSVSIDASDFVEVKGMISDFSAISSSAGLVDPIVQKRFGLPSEPRGNAGNVSINTERYSTITATAEGKGNGGNLKIDTNSLIGLENSDIAANAQQGQGGNIFINTEKLFLSPDSNITADSEFNLNGTIEINVSDLEFQNFLGQLNAKTISEEEIIAGSCLERYSSEKRSSFMYTGVESLPITPQSSVTVGEPLTKVLLPSNPSQAQRTETLYNFANPQEKLASSFISNLRLDMPIIEANEIVQTSDGKYLLVAKPQQLAAISTNNFSSCR